LTSSPSFLLQTAVFRNSSSSDIEGLALLGDLETHSMACSTCEIRFLQPWARRGLTPKEWQDLTSLLHRYLFNFKRTVNRLAQQKAVPYPFVIQCSFGCELHPNGTVRGFYDAAVKDEGCISFDVDAALWVAHQGGELAREIRDRLNQDRGMAHTIQFLLNTTCGKQIEVFTQYGKESLERRAGRRAQLRLPGGARQPGGPQPADPVE
uniref:MHC class I-like antigen recognition-like domain-containing protein n=1 Tax=Pelusios castaneus TaxID=367368 RepID=A0A8C8VP81_9SAUR